MDGSKERIALLDLVSNALRAINLNRLEGNPHSAQFILVALEHPLESYLARIHRIVVHRGLDLGSS